MIGRLFGRTNPREHVIRDLHGRINTAARVPALYTDLGAPDTVEGRFECLSLHVILVLRRLNRLPAPADEVAQDLVNAVFLQLDSSLRESGIGDFGVPKRMKKLGAAFYGRAAGYDAALDAVDVDALASVLARNVLGVDAPADATGLARYVLASDRVLAGLDLDALVGTGPLFAPLDAAAATAVQPGVLR